MSRLALRRVREAARDASSTDDLVRESEHPVPFDLMGEPLDSLLDRETLDEKASTQMGEMWESTRRGADD